MYHDRFTQGFFFSVYQFFHTKCNIVYMLCVWWQIQGSESSTNIWFSWKNTGTSWLCQSREKTILQHSRLDENNSIVYLTHALHKNWTLMSLIPGPLRIVGDVAYFQQFVIDPRVRKSCFGHYNEHCCHFSTSIISFQQHTYSHIQGLVPDEREENDILALNTPLRNSVHEYKGIHLTKNSTT